MTNPVPVRWAVARSLLDGNDTKIKSNSSISSDYTDNSEKGNKNYALGRLFIFSQRECHTMSGDENGIDLDGYGKCTYI